MSAAYQFYLYGLPAFPLYCLIKWCLYKDLRTRIRANIKADGSVEMTLWSVFFGAVTWPLSIPCGIIYVAFFSKGRK